MKKILVIDDDRATRTLLGEILKRAGYRVATARDGAAALRQINRQRFDLLVLDVWMPKMNGLELLARLRAKEKKGGPRWNRGGRARRPRVIVMTSDDTPGTLLSAVREQAFQYVSKPLEPKYLVELVEEALAAPETSLEIEVLSATPEWVELLVPCQLEVADRIQGFLMRLDSRMPADVRERVGRVFREMLVNAIEWGGKLDPKRKVRIAYLHTKRMLLYRIADPGKGFQFKGLAHSAVSYAKDQPLEHVDVREKMGLRAGGFGILMARAMVDELLYNEAQNEVVFIKYLEANS